MRKTSIITLSVLAVFFGIGLYFYYYLGGFESAEMKMINAPSCIVAGKPYKGKMNDKSLGKLFNEAEELIKKNKLDGKVCAVFYKKE
ncbi:MAG: hypothetical protein K2X86_02605 [Cytophagaceae bacterium]|nr:hypothetical protein [Cytophagaceae bacterium]